ncbi:MAG: PucR family transcriptional regulator [Mycobacteriaceae bacterium]
MADPGSRTRTAPLSAPLPAEVLAEVAASGATDAGGLSIDLLGDFLPVLTAAVAAGRPLTRRQLLAYQSFGSTAAREGVALRALLDLYSSSAWRLWRHLPAVAHAREDPAAVVVAGEVMLRAVDDAVAALAEGFQLAQRTLVRTQESARREFIDDLLTGGAGVASVLQRASGFGLDLSGPHAVAVVLGERPFADGTPLIGTLERAVLGSKGDAQALVASKEGRLVVVFPAPDRAAIAHVLAELSAVLGPRPGDPTRVELRRWVSTGAWQIGVGRPGTGAAGVVSSCQEARNALDLAERLGLTEAIVDARDLLVYNVLLRDRDAITDLVRTVLTPLLAARGGAGPLLDTLVVYFGAGGNAAHTARALHLSVRAVTYRLDRVHELTGYDPTGPSEQFALHVAVMGAKLLGWPSTPLP